MNTKKLRELASLVMAAETEPVWHKDAVNLARAVLDEVPDDDSTESRLVGVDDVIRFNAMSAKVGMSREAPTWMEEECKDPAFLRAYIDEQCKDINDRMAKLETVSRENRDRTIQLAFDEGRALADVCQRIDALESLVCEMRRDGSEAKFAKRHEELAAWVAEHALRIANLEDRGLLARDRIASLEASRNDRAAPARPDPLESARAHVAEWPEWKRQAASQQRATLDMDGNPMLSPDPLDEMPAEGEQWRNARGLEWRRVSGGEWLDPDVSDSWRDVRTRRQLLADGWTRIDEPAPPADPRAEELKRRLRSEVRAADECDANPAAPPDGDMLKAADAAYREALNPPAPPGFEIVPEPYWICEDSDGDKQALFVTQWKDIGIAYWHQAGILELEYGDHWIAPIGRPKEMP